MCVGVPYKQNGVQKRCGLNDDVTEVRWQCYSCEFLKYVLAAWAPGTYHSYLASRWPKLWPVVHHLSTTLLLERAKTPRGQRHFAS